MRGAAQRVDLAVDAPFEIGGVVGCVVVLGWRFVLGRVWGVWQLGQLCLGGWAAIALSPPPFLPCASRKYPATKSAPLSRRQSPRSPLQRLVLRRRRAQPLLRLGERRRRGAPQARDLVAHSGRLLACRADVAIEAVAQRAVLGVEALDLLCLKSFEFRNLNVGFEHGRV